MFGKFVGTFQLYGLLPAATVAIDVYPLGHVPQVRRPLGRAVPVGPAAEGEQHERQVAAGIGQDVLLAGTCPLGLVGRALEHSPVDE